MLMIFLLLSVLTLLVSCVDIKIQDTEVCTVAGKLIAGGDCAHTLKPDTRQMSFEEFVKFLEPQEEIKNEKGEIIQAARGPALCQSSNDWNKMKTTLEQACELLKDRCTYELKQTIERLDTLLQVK